MKQMDEHFKELVYKYTNKLYVTAYNLCNNPSDAEDIVQETFMKYLKKKPIFANEEHEKAWLLRVTINLAKDYNKSFWNRRTEKMSEAIEDHSTDHGIYEMISNLPDKYKILLILRYQEGLTYKEIGEILHRKTSTVSAQIHKAKELLKSQLLS